MLKKIRKILIFVWFRVRNFWPFWWYIINRKPRALFSKNRPNLDILQERIVGDLKENGISVSTLDELFPGSKLLPVLQKYAYENDADAISRTKKLFLESYWDVTPEFDIKNPFVKLSIDNKIVDIVNTYMGMWTKLKYFTLLKTIPVFGSTAVQSQRWHRDPEEKRMCKMFIYLTDVDEESGPFIYVSKSPYGLKYGELFPQKTPEGVYPEDGTVETYVTQEDILTFTGKAGTVIFCDTSGIHRGGFAKSKSRIMFTSFYAAPSFLTEKRRYSVTENIFSKLPELSPSVRFCLSED